MNVSPYPCEVCGGRVDYDGDGKRYSSIRGDENGVASVRTCSGTCRETDKAKQLVAEYDQREERAAHHLRYLEKRTQRKISGEEKIKRLQAQIAAIKQKQVEESRW